MLKNLTSSKNLTYGKVNQPSNQLTQQSHQLKPITITAEIDLGYWYSILTSNSKPPFNLNAQNSQSQFQIRSKVEITQETSLQLSPKTYLYQHDDLKAIIGESASQHSLELDKTQNIAYQILTYSLIAQLVQTNQPTILNLTINYPLNIYNSQTKQSFEQFIRTKDFINIFLNNKQKTFHIPNVTVFPQCIPVAYVNPQYFQNQITAIVDIGGYTAQGIILDNFNIIPDTQFSETLGCHILYNKIRQTLNSKFSTNIQDYQIPSIIQNSLQSHPQESQTIISDIINSHINQIKKQMTIKNWDINNLNILFTGGGSLVMKKQLLSQFPYSKISQDPLYDNVKGLRKVSESIYKE